MTLFSEIAIVVVLAAALGFLAHFLKQPTVVGYLVAGILIGPLGYWEWTAKWLAQIGSPVSNHFDVLNVFSEIGITLLLFMVGLEINTQNLKEVGKPALWTGLGQIVFTFAAGFFLVRFLGFSELASAYISIALTFSSTIIVVQLLSQKKDLNSLYGKIVVGFLLVQDFIAILALIFLSGFSNTAGSTSLFYSVLGFLFVFLKGGVLLFATVYLSRKLFPRLMNLIGRSQEILYIFSLAWGLGLAALMASPWIGFSIEIGGLLAGLALANSVTHFQVASRMKPVRDFFIMLFFVALGARLAVGDFSAILSPAAILSVFVLIGNPIIVMIIMAGLGYRSRTSFLSSLTVAQISEFSLILAALGLRLGHLTNSEGSLVTLVGIVTITISSYFILYGDHIYVFMKPALKVLEFRKRKAEELQSVLPYANHTVLFGAHRMGSNILAALKATDEPFVVVDFDPAIIQALIKKDIPVLYGDSNDDEIRNLAGLPRARVVISTIPDFKDNLSLLAFMKKENPRAVTIVTSENEWEAKELYHVGVDYVILPHFVGGLQIAQAIQHDPNYSQLEALRLHDLAFIKER